MNQKKRLVLIDGHSVVFRAFYAIPYLTSPSGEQVNAVYGFALILLNVIAELAPTHIVVTFDTSAPTFRHTNFAAYKAQREEAPSELKDQLGKVHEVVEALNVPIFEVEGYEADDVIGTLAGQASKPPSFARDFGRAQQSLKASKLETVIVTGDKDMFQLVRNNLVKVYVPAKGKQKAVMYEEEEVLVRMGVRVDQIPDYKGLAGDSSDNIPGIKGIGPKTAVRILREFGSIDGFYQFLVVGDDETKAPITNNQLPNNIKYPITNIKTDKTERLKKAGVTESVLKKMMEGYEMAIKSRELATIDTDVPIKFDLAKCELCDYDKERVTALFEELGFKSLVGKLPDDKFEKGVQEALF